MRKFTAGVVLIGAATGSILGGAASAQLLPGQERRPLVIEAATPLSFGRVSTRGRQAGEAIIDPRTGAKSVRGGALDLGGDHAAAEFRISGEPNQMVGILLPSEASMVDRSGAQAGRLDAFTSHPQGVVTLGPRGEASLRVGATWRIDPNVDRVEPQAQFSVVVEYLD